MADALVLGTSSERVRVRPPSPAPKKNPSLSPGGRRVRIFSFRRETGPGKNRHSIKAKLSGSAEAWSGRICMASYASVPCSKGFDWGG